MSHPLVNRTSPKGQSFVGTCAACGKTGLTFKTMHEDCPNQREMTREQAIIEAIEGKDITFGPETSQTLAQILANDRSRQT
jgi:hypothetical protein